MAPVAGGCINECFEVQTSHGKFFLKKNDAKAYPKMFDSEAKALELLNGRVEGIAPEVIFNGEDGDEIFLILQWIEKGIPRQTFWDDFAQKLSILHHGTNKMFGLDHSNYIGSLLQHNEPMQEWNSFFILQRIEPQLKKAIDEKILSKEIHRSFEKVFVKLADIFPPATPSLLHGDLWSGNFMVAEDGCVRLIDPAVYYGHREMDLAMTKLFGGFDNSFYSAYNNYFPIEKNFDKRADVFNLYPLLVHVNLFGGSYVNEVLAIVKRFM